MKAKYKKTVHRKVIRQRYRKYTKQPSGKGLRVLPSTNALLHTPLLPLKFNCKLPYHTYSSYTHAANSAGGYVFTANGLYDPDITSAGHQPMGFDTMMQFYEHYTVTKCKMTVSWYNTDGTYPCVVGLLVAPDATIETNISKLNENGMYKKHWLTSSAGSDQKCSITLLADISKINGKKDVKSEDDFRGDSASNPPEQTYFHLFVYNTIAATVVSVYFETLIEYDAVFTEPRKMVQS